MNEKGNFDFEIDEKETETMMTMLVKIQDYRPQNPEPEPPTQNLKKCQVALITQPPSFLFLVPSPWWLCLPCVSSLSLRRCRCRYRCRCAFSRGIYEEGCWSN
jgi:hypothetical protein